VLPAPPTEVLTVRGHSYYTRRFAAEVIDGPDRGARFTSTRDELTIGTDAGNELRLTDPAVSRHHCVLRATARGLEVRDLGSTNGTHSGGVELIRAYLTTGARLRLGQSQVAIELLSDEVRTPLAPGDRFGELVGASPLMRRMFALLERYAQGDGTVLISGETGTGKELVAEAIHGASARRRGPFVVVDCGALPAQLTESELFGHVRGAFTGAEHDRRGAFEQAHGGTIFLDEIGELPLPLQPLLLRALEARTVRPVGGSGERAVDVRVIAASHRDLRVEVNRKRFRSDLYFRLAVLPVEVPPLRDRTGDLEVLIAHFWPLFRPGQAPPPDVVTALARLDWPGNVRELRNAVERAAVIGLTGLGAPLGGAGPGAPVDAPALDDLSYGQAKERAVWEWESSWIAGLVRRHGGNLSAAARAARMGRSHLRSLLRRYGHADGDGGDDEA
jgi:two-component system response regulator GlrR